MSVGLPEIILVLLIVLLIFGSKRIPELGRALGTGLRELREHVGRKSDEEERIDPGQEDTPPSSGEPAEHERPAKRP